MIVIKMLKELRERVDGLSENLIIEIASMKGDVETIKRPSQK